MNLSKTKTIISVAVVSMLGAAGYAYAQQTGAQQPDSSSAYKDGNSMQQPNSSSTYRDGSSTGANNPNVPSAAVSGAVGETSGSTSTTDSSRMNSDGTMRDRTTTGEPSARADRN